MEQALPWVSQGDIFSTVPRAALQVNLLGTIEAELVRVPAILVSHGCDLDKRTGAGVMKIERMMFTPLRPMVDTDATRQALLRKREVNPPEAFYVGDVNGVESFALASEIFAVPAQFFSPTIRQHPHPAAEPDGHLTLNTNDSRIGTVSEDDRALLGKKLAAFFSRLKPKD